MGNRHRKLKQLATQKESEEIAIVAKRIVQEALQEAERATGMTLERFVELQYGHLKQ